MVGKYAVIDVETTGASPQTDKIIELAIVCIDDGQQGLTTWSSLINPQRKVPAFITRLTGITDELLAPAPNFTQLRTTILEMLAGRIIVGHNVQFDLAFLESELGQALPNRYLDTVSIAKMVLPTQKSYRLGYLTEDLSIVHEAKHRAQGDAEATAELFLALRQQILEWPWALVYTIQNLLQQSEATYKEFFTQTIKTKTAGYGFDKQVVQSWGQADTGIFAAASHNEQLSTNAGRKTSQTYELKIDLGEVKQLLKPEGGLDQNVANYEYRPQQIAMLEAIVEALNSQKHLVVEAGTGTGKSLAYLVPALYWAVTTGQKVVVSTNTINLQEQLWHKDIPLLKQVLALEFQAAVVKGRSNFVCLRRWQHWWEEFGHLPQNFVFAVQIHNWLTKTQVGDRSELNQNQRDNEQWMAICGDAEACLGTRCTYYQQKCFIMRAKRLAEEADLLIANHSLVLADIKLDNQVLPNYQVLILDEAHHLEDEATEQLGWDFSYAGIMRQLNNLYNSPGQENLGYINSLRFRLAHFSEALDKEELESFTNLLETNASLVNGLKESIINFFRLVNQLTRDVQSEGGERFSFRLDRPEMQETWWRPLDSDISNIQFRFKDLILSLKKLLSILESSQYGATTFAEDIKDLQGYLSTLREQLGCFDFVTNPTDNNFVYWVEGFQHDGSYRLELKAVPITVNTILYEKMFSEKKSVILTSATLTVNNRFDYILERFGLNLVVAEGVSCLQVDSPFDYDQQALLCLVRDLPDPTESELGFIDGVSHAIQQLSLASSGRTLVLFTSHRMLKEVYENLKEPMEGEGFALLGHNIDGGRSKIVDEFKRAEQAVLLGTSSFWEGLDLPGDLLKCLIIVKMPFAVPVVPQIEARIEQLEKNNQDSFLSFTLPQAIIKFKQGFGRLIRSQRDHGVVIVLDKRLISKRYGKHFLRSLPVRNHFRGELDLVVEKISTWLKGSQRETKPRWKSIDNLQDLDQFLKNIN